MEGTEALGDPPTTGVSVWGGATVFMTTAQLPCFLPAVVGASPCHPIVSCQATESRVGLVSGVYWGTPLMGLVGRKDLGERHLARQFSREEQDNDCICPS